MSLEGPRVSHLAEIRSQLYAATPRGWWRTQGALQGVFDPFKAHPWFLLFGVLGGAWLAGSKTGQSLTSRFIKKRR